jgi:hypothetical protein
MSTPPEFRRSGWGLRERRAWLGMILLATAIAGGHHLRWWSANDDRRVAATGVAAWMADALPGIGPATRARLAAAIRNGQWQHLPTSARVIAHQVISDCRVDDQ